MADLKWSLYFYDSGTWEDITDYVLSISEFRYEIDTRSYGVGPVIRVVLDSSCSAREGKYKLKIGSHYIYFSATGDCIEESGQEKVTIALIDDFILSLDGKQIKLPSGVNECEALAGGKFDVKLYVNKFTGDLAFRSKPHDMDIPRTQIWSKLDNKKYFWSAEGIIIYQEEEPRYEYQGKVGVLKVGNTTYKVRGYQFMNIKTILSQIISDESYGCEIEELIKEDTTDKGVYLGTGEIEQIWDAKYINGKLVILYSKRGTLVIKVKDTSGTDLYTKTITTQDFRDPFVDGTDAIAYQIYADYYANAAYIPFWYCSDFDADTTNQYYLRVIKIDLSGTGATLSYDRTLSATEFMSVITDPRTSDADTRESRWEGDYTICGFINFHFYYDETGIHNLIIWEHSQYLHVMDIDRLVAGSSNWKYVYDFGSSSFSHYMVPDDMNALVGTWSYDTGSSSWYLNFANVAIDFSGGSPSGVSKTKGGKVVDEDDWGANASSYCHGKWYHSIYWKKGSSGDYYYYRIPQIWTGFLQRSGIYNRYNRDVDDPLSIDSAFQQTEAGTSWDRINDIAFIWRKWTGPGINEYLKFCIRKGYIWPRVWRYQPLWYKDRKQQFIDAFLTFGWFYQQINGKIKLIRIKESSSSIGTFSTDDVLTYRKYSGDLKYGTGYSFNVLSSTVTVGDTDRIKEVRTVITRQGWIPAQQVEFVNADWTDIIKADKDYVEITCDLDAFHDKAGKYMPTLGEKFTFDSNDYLIVAVKINVMNNVIRIKGVKI